jgi:hypothetical protein
MSDEPFPNAQVIADLPSCDYTDALLDAYGAIEAEWAGIAAAVELEHAREMEALRNWTPVASVKGGTPVLAADQCNAYVDPPAPPVTPSGDGERGPRYVRAALEGEAREIAAAPVGLRNERTNRAAWTLARLVLDGLVDASAVETVLVAAGMDAGLPEREARATVRGALRRRGAL